MAKLLGLNVGPQETNYNVITAGYNDESKWSTTINGDMFNVHTSENIKLIVGSEFSIGKGTLDNSNPVFSFDTGEDSVNINRKFKFDRR